MRGQGHLDFRGRPCERCTFFPVDDQPSSFLSVAESLFAVAAVLHQRVLRSLSQYSRKARHTRHVRHQHVFPRKCRTLAISFWPIDHFSPFRRAIRLPLRTSTDASHGASTDQDPQEEECEEGNPVLPDGLRCLRNWCVPAATASSLESSLITPCSGRTTFVNTLCGKKVLEGKGAEADDAENAHLEEGVKIKPITVGQLSFAVVPSSSASLTCCDRARA